MPYEWSIEGTLPEGLIATDSPMTGELRILGNTTETRVANLLVQVVDSQQRRAIRALTIRVADPIQQTGSGGGCTAIERSDRSLWSLLAIALLTALWVGRPGRSLSARRRTSR